MDGIDAEHGAVTPIEIDPAIALEPRAITRGSPAVANG
jgi:hypothetical protein